MSHRAVLIGPVLIRARRGILSLPTNLLFASIPLAAALTSIPVLEYGRWSLRVIDLVLLAYAGLLLVSVILRDRVRSLALMPVSGITIILMSAVLGTLLPTAYDTDIARLLRFIEVLALGVLVAVHRPSTKWINHFLLVLVVAGATLSATSIGLSIVAPELHRIAGWFSAAGGEVRDVQASFNEIGAFLVLALLANWNLLRGGSRGLFMNVVLFGCLPLLLAGILLTQSRASVLALSIVCMGWITWKVIQFLRTFHFRPHRIGVAVLALTIAMSVAIIVSTMLPIDRIAATFQEGSSASESLVIRVGLWTRAMELWGESFAAMLVGRGYGSLILPLGARSAHNFVLDIGLSLGVLGLIGTALVYAGPLIYGFLRSIPRRGLLLSAYGLLFVVTLTSNIAVDPVFGSTIVALIFAVAGEGRR